MTYMNSCSHTVYSSFSVDRWSGENMKLLLLSVYKKILDHIFSWAESLPRAIGVYFVWLHLTVSSTSCFYCVKSFFLLLCLSFISDCNYSLHKVISSNHFSPQSPLYSFLIRWRPLKFMTSSGQLNLKSVSIFRESVIIWDDFIKWHKVYFNCLVLFSCKHL